MLKVNTYRQVSIQKRTKLHLPSTFNNDRADNSYHL